MSFRDAASGASYILTEKIFYDNFKRSAEIGSEPFKQQEEYKNVITVGR